MAASYPSSVRNFGTKIDFVTPVVAADPNSIQEEVVAIENTLGLSPTISTANDSAGSYQNSPTIYPTVSARIANVEQGVVADVHTQYIRRNGGEAVINVYPASRALLVKGAALQTAFIFDVQDSAGNSLLSVSAAGVLTAKSFNTPDLNNAILLGIFGN